MLLLLVVVVLLLLLIVVVAVRWLALVWVVWARLRWVRALSGLPLRRLVLVRAGAAPPVPLAVSRVVLPRTTLVRGLAIPLPALLLVPRVLPALQQPPPMLREIVNFPATPVMRLPVPRPSHCMTVLPTVARLSSLLPPGSPFRRRGVALSRRPRRLLRRL